mmetsp:Transcript_58826/g.182721  ORF Transcript_58826/g.182721 Transcript_58826/m.182721 type:complete len:372 (+) Transcript_58826:327-1442(+)
MPRALQLLDVSREALDEAEDARRGWRRRRCHRGGLASVPGILVLKLAEPPAQVPDVALDLLQTVVAAAALLLHLPRLLCQLLDLVAGRLRLGAAAASLRAHLVLERLEARVQMRNLLAALLLVALDAAERRLGHLLGVLDLPSQPREVASPCLHLRPLLHAAQAFCKRIEACCPGLRLQPALEGAEAPGHFRSPAAGRLGLGPAAGVLGLHRVDPLLQLPDVVLNLYHLAVATVGLLLQISSSLRKLLELAVACLHVRPAACADLLLEHLEPVLELSEPAAGGLRLLPDLPGQLRNLAARGVCLDHPLEVLHTLCKHLDLGGLGLLREPVLELLDTPRKLLHVAGAGPRLHLPLKLLHFLRQARELVVLGA